MLQELPPALLVLLRPFADAQHLAVSALVHSHRHQHRYVPYLTAPAPLQPDPIQPCVYVLPFNLPVAPLLDPPRELLVQLADRRGAYPAPPQRLRDVLHPAHRHARQVHLNQRLLHRTLSPPVPLDDLRLERQAPQLRHTQHYLAGLRMQRPLISACTRIHPLRRPLVSPCLAQPIRLRVQQSVERLFHRAPHHLVYVRPDLSLVHRQNVLQPRRLFRYPLHGQVSLPVWHVVFLTTPTSRRPALCKVRKIAYVIPPAGRAGARVHRQRAG